MGTDGWTQLKQQVARQELQIEALTDFVTDLIVRLTVLEHSDDVHSW